MSKRFNLRCCFSAAIKTISVAVAFFSVASYVFLKPALAKELKPGQESPLTLEETIDIALKNNIGLQNSYRDRIVQKYVLKVAEDKFIPKPVLATEARQTSSRTDGLETTKSSSATTLTVSETIHSGAQINLALSETVAKTEHGASESTGTWGVTVSQPLLKGGGFDVTLASVRTARINETVNILNLKSSIIDLVSSVITSYRTYLQAREQLEIARQSLQRAKELVGINRELIAAGRMAEVEIVQTEADVANREFNVLSAENSADSARLALVKLLDVDKRIIIIPTEKISTKAVTFDINELKRTAFANRNDYLSALLKVDVSKMDLMTAQNNKLWDLSLVGGYDGSYGTRTSMDDSRTNSWNLGLKLTIPFRDLTLEQNYLNARIALEKDEANLAKLRETIEIDVQDALREVDMKYRQVILAQQARVLSGKKLDIEREKMKSGRSTNFQLVSYENDLVNALNGELSAGINYQNAMAVLDRTLGTTLDRWGIMVSDKRGTQP